MQSRPQAPLGWYLTGWLWLVLPCSAQDREVPATQSAAQNIPAPIERALEGLEATGSAWTAEVWNDSLGEPIRALRDVVWEASKPDEAAWQRLCAPDAQGTWLKGQALGGGAPDWDLQQGVAGGPEGLMEGWKAIRGRLAGPLSRTEWHVEGLQVVDAETAHGTLRLQWICEQPGRRGTMHSLWDVTWRRRGQAILWQRVEEREAHWLTLRGAEPGFVDRSHEVFPSPAYRNQLSPGIDFWRERLDAGLGTGILGHQGLAIGDVDGDGLEDVYVLEPGGLPNRLFLHQPDGSTREVAKEAGLDVLNYSSSALWVDLDGDSDKDLVLATAEGVRVLEQKSRLRFVLAYSFPGPDCTSLAAADVDLDGDVDIYVCRYSSPYESSGLPFPYHDAENGAANWMLENLGSFSFRESSEAWGLSEGATRFSFAASFEDYDNDGDLDLYVANDFGRNALYRKEGKRFREVAGEVSAQDVAAGMGVTWGDWNHDGLMDLYVSNMDSNAGQRVTTQANFLPGADPAERELFFQHARGSATYIGIPGGHFEDRTMTSGARRSLWAWGGLSGDLDLDGNLDLVVPNGFVTGESTKDL
ncbi:MAG TPA: VCBS repeat-containing protein [Planctomycetota bacterium]|nr:VCBS repeat-containing protein [Planctomycetota bacterium]